MEKFYEDDPRKTLLSLIHWHIGVALDPAVSQVAAQVRNEAQEHECETCRGIGTIDETLGGESFSNPKAKCPDCDGDGYYWYRKEDVDKFL